MKGFIDINEIINNHLSHSRKRLIPINLIDGVTYDLSDSTIIEYKEELIYTEESYEQVKQLIKEAQ